MMRSLTGLALSCGLLAPWGAALAQAEERTSSTTSPTVLEPAATFDYERNVVGDDALPPLRLQPESPTPRFPLAEPLLHEEETTASPNMAMLKGFAGRGRPRSSPLKLEYTFLSPARVEGTSSEVAIHELALAYRLGLPPLHQGLFLSVRPMFEEKFLTGLGDAPGLNVPHHLYKVALDFNLRWQAHERCGVMLGMTTGVWTDFDHVDGADWRFPARLLADWKYSERLSLVGGLVYTDNLDWPIIPAVGLIWQPTEATTLELIFPRPRFAYRVQPGWQVWGSFELAGNTYNIQTPTGQQDLNIQDFRFLAGTQHQLSERALLTVESGISVGRQFDFSAQPDRDLDPAFIVRAGFEF